MANANKETILQLDLPGIKKVRSGKVREVFDLGDRFCSSPATASRPSTSSCPTAFRARARCSRKFRISGSRNFRRSCRIICSPSANDPLPKNLQPFAAQLARRSMIVKKAKPLAIECIVRGYLSGSGWKEYKKSQTVCGIKLPAGLTESAELPEPIFTPSTKAEAGHDENISFEEACKNHRHGTRHAGARLEPENLPGRTRLRPPARHHHRRHEIRVRPVRTAN
jgi:phosphoribosylaminoimidazole-succinocarboxamide synthase